MRKPPSCTAISGSITRYSTRASREFWRFWTGMLSTLGIRSSIWLSLHALSSLGEQFRGLGGLDPAALQIPSEAESVADYCAAWARARRAAGLDYYLRSICSG